MAHTCCRSCGRASPSSTASGGRASSGRRERRRRDELAPLLKFNDHSVNLSLADVLSAVRHGLTPKYVASLALKHAYRPVGVSVLHTIVSQGVENVLRMSVHPFACARLQPQFQYAYSIVLKPNGQPLR